MSCLITESNPLPQGWNQEFHLDPYKELNDSRYQMRMNQFLAIITTVAFTIIAVAALTLASLFIPTAIPFILLGTTALIPVFKQYIYDYFWGKERLYAEIVRLQERVIKNIPEDSEDLELLVPGNNIDENSKKSMLFILAKYRTMKDDVESEDAALTEFTNKINNNAGQITPSPDENIKKLAVNACKTILQDNRKMSIVANKVKAAWFLYLMRNPTFQGTFKDKLTIHYIDPTTRSLNKDDPVADVFLEFPGQKTFYTITNLMNNSIEEISGLLKENLEKNDSTD
jgi:hypothetical protein